MVLLDPSDTALAAIVHSINATTPVWELGPLSSSWIYVNGSILNGSYVNGYNYNGSTSSIGNTTIVQRKEINDVGTLPLRDFVYLIISVAMVLALLALPNGRYILKIIFGNDARFGSDRPNSSMSEYAFDRELRTIYPPDPPEPLHSYLETIDYLPNKDVSSTDIRECQSMIRKIYALKVDVFNARDVRRANQDIVTGWKAQSTAGLRDVKTLVDKWGQRQDWSLEEKAKVDEIRQRILAIPSDT